LGIDINNPEFVGEHFKFVRASFLKVDLLDKDQVENILSSFRPDYILHLASYSSVAYSWKHPVSAFVNNSNIFLNLIDQVRILALPCRILSIGSSEEYGSVQKENLPLREESVTKPSSPYAVARVSQEMLSQVYAHSYGIDIVLTRSFNHIGPGQRELFATSSFAKKLIIIKHDAALQRKVTVGNLEVVRDFVDVRDVARAYHLLLHKGKKGEIYNICSGVGHSLKQILLMMMKMEELDVELIVDPELIRPEENNFVIGSNDKICRELGWAPKIPIEESIRDILKFWDDQLQNPN
jgi:GDP-4-dehydro-6-deoxy-D-mannose reductase